MTGGKKKEEAGFGRLTVQGVLYINNIIRALPLWFGCVCVYLCVYTSSQSSHSHNLGGYTQNRILVPQEDSPNGERRIPMCGGSGEREIRFVSLELELN